MSKLTYLQLTNRVLGRITNTTISNVTAATGNALIVTQLINEAQTWLFTEEDWYSLYTSRTFNTSASTSTYAVATAFGRCISLTDTTNNRVLNEDYSRSFDEIDPNQSTSGIPELFGIEGSNYRLWPIPAGTYSITDRYWKIPTALAANTDTSDLPIECENVIIQYAFRGLLEYLNKIEQADRASVRLAQELARASVANKRRLDKMRVLTSSRKFEGSLVAPRLPSNYPAV